METSQEDISKLVSYWLRHNPKDAKVEVDEFGWVSLAGLLSALQDKNIFVAPDNLIRLNNSFDKIRWEIDVKQNKIRATHGHSFPVLPDDKN